jgi:drug/metabolite transporter (DMT)-like permease
LVGVGVSALVLGLVLVAGLLHALWNLAAKKADAGIALSALSSTAAVVLWSPLGGPVLAHEMPSWSGAQWACLAGSATLHVIYFATLLRGYQVGDLSVVYPVARGTGPLITVVVSVFVFGEKPTVFGVLGVLGIVCGVVLIATGGRIPRADNLAAGLGYGLLTGLTIAAYSVLDGYGVKKIGLSPIGLDYGSNLIRAVLTIPIALFVLHRAGLDRRQFIAKNARFAGIIGLLSPAAYVLVLQAAKLSDLSKVAPAREVSMLFAALFAGSLLKEEGFWVRFAGAICIGFGVAAVAFS